MEIVECGIDYYERIIILLFEGCYDEIIATQFLTKCFPTLINDSGLIVELVAQTKSNEMINFGSMTYCFKV